MGTAERRRLVSELFKVSHVLRIIKLPLSLLISISALFGLAFANANAAGSHYAILFLGTLMVVAAGAMLNNVADIEIDKIMRRTQNRPLPLGVYSPRVVQVIALLLMHGGFLVLAKLPNGVVVSLLSGVGLALYNFVYTPLKRKTILAIIPGAACGVVPPAMGWFAGGGSWASFDFWILCAVLLVWQFPHFWLILLFRRGDYFAARIPNFLEKYGESALKRMLFVWLLVYALLLSLIGTSSGIEFAFTRLFVAANAVGIAVASVYIVLGGAQSPRWRPLFVFLNATLALVMFATIVEKVFL